MDTAVTDALTRVRVVEFSTITPGGGVHTRPMSAIWEPDRGQIILTTPIAYPQKAFNVRRDGRVALLYSDPTGSGLTGSPTVLVQGRATVPDGVAAPEDVPAYWQGLFRKSPETARQTSEELASADYRRLMDWYYWRFPFYVTPERVEVQPAARAGGVMGRPDPTPDIPMAEHIRDALSRYPTAVFAGRDEQGWPSATRAVVSARDGGASLLVRPAHPVPVRSGPASLLWHRHDGRSGEMSALLVAGAVSGDTAGLRFVPERIPGMPPSGSEEVEWHVQGRQAALRYLERRGIDPPEVGWDTLAGYAGTTRQPGG